MMTPAIRSIATALTVAATGACHCWAQGGSPPAPPASATWRIESAPDQDSQQEAFSLVTAALGNTGATFGLWCRPDLSLYALIVRDSRLAQLARDAEVTVAVRFPNQEPVRWQAASRGDGSVVIQERTHQTAFTLILASLKQHDGASVELSIGNDQWVFRLDGFSGSLPALIERCEFEPDPARARVRGDQPSRPPPLPRAR
jgi:hypothetical protein